MSTCVIKTDGVYTLVINSVTVTLQFSCDQGWLLTTDAGTYVAVSSNFPLTFQDVDINGIVGTIVVTLDDICCEPEPPIVITPIPPGEEGNNGIGSGLVFGGSAGLAEYPMIPVGGLRFGSPNPVDFFCGQCDMMPPLPPLCVTIAGMFWFVGSTNCYGANGPANTPPLDATGPFNGTFEVPWNPLIVTGAPQLGQPCRWQLQVDVPLGGGGVNGNAGCNIAHFTITVTINNGNLVAALTPHEAIYAYNGQGTFWTGDGFDCTEVNNLTATTYYLISQIGIWHSGFGTWSQASAICQIKLGKCSLDITPQGGLRFGGAPEGGGGQITPGCGCGGTSQNKYWVSIGDAPAGLPGLAGVWEVDGIAETIDYCCWTHLDVFLMGIIPVYIHLVYFNNGGGWTWFVKFTDASNCYDGSSVQATYMGPAATCDPSGAYVYTHSNVLSGWPPVVYVCKTPCWPPVAGGGLVFGGGVPNVNIRSVYMTTDTYLFQLPTCGACAAASLKWCLTVSGCSNQEVNGTYTLGYNALYGVCSWASGFFNFSPYTGGQWIMHFSGSTWSVSLQVISSGLTQSWQLPSISFSCASTSVLPYSGGSSGSGITWPSTVSVVPEPCGTYMTTDTYLVSTRDAIQFSGSTSSYMSGSDSSMPSGTTDRTYSMWCKFASSIPATPDGRILEYGTFTGLGFGTPGSIRLLCGSNNQFNACSDSCCGNVGSPIDITNKFLMTWTESGGIWSLYLNGAQSTTIFPAVFSTSINTVLSGLVKIGVGYQLTVQDIRVYNRALSGSEVLTMYNGGTQAWSIGTTSGLTNWWKTDEGGSTIAHDSVGGNHLTLTGASWTAI